jgi:hypothetical protein
MHEYRGSLSMERGRQVSLAYAWGHLLVSSIGLLYGNFFRFMGRRRSPLQWLALVVALLISVQPMIGAEGGARWMFVAFWLFTYLVVLPATIFLIDAHKRRATNR